MDAVLITPEATTQRLQLPDAGGEQREALAAYLGGRPERAVYHHGAVFHLHEEGRTIGMPPNVVAWALACAWRGRRLPDSYLLCGSVVITGPGDLGYVSLDEALIRQVEYAAATARVLAGQSTNGQRDVDRLLQALAAFSV